MITGKLSSGYKFSVDETVTDEWDFVKAIGLCESKNVAESVYGMTKIIEMLLGPEGEADLVNFIKKKNGGKCSQQHMSDAILEIFSKIKEDKEGKNSETSPE